VSSFWTWLIRRLLKRVTPNSNPTQSTALKGFFQMCRPIQTEFELVRVGPQYDGGYLIPNDLQDLVACFSPGVGDIVGFELDMLARGIPCYLLDASVRENPIQDLQAVFDRYYLSSYDDAESITLESWVTKYAPSSGDLILQMDVEGAEYGVIEQTSIETLMRFRIIVIEFHFTDYLFDSFGFKIINNSLKKILQKFSIVHIHPNNNSKTVMRHGIALPQALEFTFLRKDRHKKASFVTAYPNGLDMPCNPRKSDIVLPSSFFKL
jgi:hypothetical protein